MEYYCKELFPKLETISNDAVFVELTLLYTNTKFKGSRWVTFHNQIASVVHNIMENENYFHSIIVSESFKAFMTRNLQNYEHLLDQKQTCYWCLGLFLGRININDYPLVTNPKTPFMNSSFLEVSPYLLLFIFVFKN